MSLPGKWHPKFWRRKLPAPSGSEVNLTSTPASGLDDLQARLNQWSHLWTHESDAGTRTEAQELVAARLSHWLESCFGQQVRISLSGKDSRISLASSTPIFAAFLGRRATRELSRRVLHDI